MYKNALFRLCFSFLTLPSLALADFPLTPFPFCELSAMHPGERVVRPVSIFRFGRYHRERLGLSRVALIAAEPGREANRVNLSLFDLGEDLLVPHLTPQRIHTDQIQVVDLSIDEARRALRELSPLGLAGLELRVIRDVSLPRGSHRISAGKLAELEPGDALLFSNRYFVVTEMIAGPQVFASMLTRGLPFAAIQNARILRLVELPQAPRPGVRHMGVQQDLLINSATNRILGRRGLVPGPFYLLGRASFIEGTNVVRESTVGDSNLILNRAVATLRDFRVP